MSAIVVIVNLLIFFFSLSFYFVTPSHATSSNVGIGTTTPNAKLNVDPQGAGSILLGNPSTASGGYTSLSMGISAASNGYGSIQSIQSAGSNYGILSLEPFGGSVGIGTTNPFTKLDVFDTSDPSGTSIQVEAGDTSTSPGISFVRSSSERWTIGADAADNYKLKFALTGGNPSFATDTKMTINNSGNVGIGTTSPSDTLMVSSANASGITVAVPFNDATVALKGNTSSGSNGMGDITFSNLGSTQGAQAVASIQGLTGSSSKDTGALAFYVKQNPTDSTFTSAMYIANSGNVGIGTTNPQTALDVSTGGIRPIAATASASCSPIGATAYNTSTGAPLYCSNTGVWTAVTSGGGFTSCTTYNSGLIADGTTGVYSQSCPSGTAVSGSCSSACAWISTNYLAGNTQYCQSINPGNECNGTNQHNMVIYVTCCH